MSTLSGQPDVAHAAAILTQTYFVKLAQKPIVYPVPPSFLQPLPERQIIEKGTILVQQEPVVYIGDPPVDTVVVSSETKKQSKTHNK